MEYNNKIDENDISAEILGGIKFFAGNTVEINLGGGLGVRPGIGTTDSRLFFGLSSKIGRSMKKTQKTKAKSQK